MLTLSPMLRSRLALLARGYRAATEPLQSRCRGYRGGRTAAVAVAAGALAAGGCSVAFSQPGLTEQLERILARLERVEAAASAPGLSVSVCLIHSLAHARTLSVSLCRASPHQRERR